MSKENILNLVESQMSSNFLRTIRRAQGQVNYAHGQRGVQVHNIGQEFETMEISNADTIVDGIEELDALQNRQKKKTDALTP